MFTATTPWMVTTAALLACACIVTFEWRKALARREEYDQMREDRNLAIARWNARRNRIIELQNSNASLRGHVTKLQRELHAYRKAAA